MACVAAPEGEATSENGPEVVVLSPHLDDAVLSLGALMARLAAAGRRVEVWTVFTAEPSILPDDPGLACFADYETRMEEDQRALVRLGVGHRWLGHRERVWREPRIFDPGEIFHMPDSIEAFDNLEAIKKSILELLDTPAVQVLAPLGIGRHFDHVEVALAAMGALIESGAYDRVRFFEDIYALDGCCRRHHFLARQKMPFFWASPVWTSPRLMALLFFVALKGRGPGIESYLPALTRLTWSAVPEPVDSFEVQKLEAIAEYRSQVAPLGGAKPVGRSIRKYHVLFGGELTWRAQLPT